MKYAFVLIAVSFFFFTNKKESESWIRINQLGYTPAGIKVAVWASKDTNSIKEFSLIDSATGKLVFKGKAGKSFGAYGPFAQSFRLNFTSFNKPGKYYIKAGTGKSPVFKIADDVYNGAADFCLRYMRQQRSGFNPYLKDSCHTHDGYVMYGKDAGIPDSTHFDVSGGWHDATDYLQYVTTSANATYHLLMSYRDFPSVFGDTKMSNGLDGSNSVADVMDEAKWGLEWLSKMHPQPGIMFNQLGDDRDHIAMRLPKEDSSYGKGFERPVYFITGEPQGLGKYKNRTLGTSSTAAKVSAAFSLGSDLFRNIDRDFSLNLWPKALSAQQFADRKKGVTQTAPMKSPYFYEEDNWVDDMELKSAAYGTMVNKLGGNPFEYIDGAYRYAKDETVTPWLGADTAKHYQWYPFVNVGHYELARLLGDKRIQHKDSLRSIAMRKEVIGWYKEGILKVWSKAKNNAFYRAIPYIWCSNNLTVSFATQCYWYRTLSGDNSFAEMEQACFDWIFGCNPWGTSMVYGLPSFGDTPTDPHSSFTIVGKFPIDGGLVDGPVYTSIFKNLLGLTLYSPDEYSNFQSDLAVYHDDYGDYSTNEPTMDGTASLIYLLAAKEAEAGKGKK